VAANLSAVGFFGPTNVLFATNGTATSTASTTLGGAQANGSDGTITSGNPYSLTDYISVNVTALATTTDKHFEVGSNIATAASNVPEPTNISLVGGGILLLAAGLTRRQRLKRVEPNVVLA
jgi:hypothetical protein